jgi:hypothetical protein
MKQKQLQSNASDFVYRTLGLVGSSSFCVVLPKNFVSGLGLSRGDYVRVIKEEGRIIIEKDE